ncbi:MAG: four helix bundle protein [Deltaproteobacteria bacterium]|nr:four helix bundle protein [Deltaproteobacteria bacterium]
MATIKRFEDIEAWRKARELAKIIYGEVRAQLYVAMDQNYIEQDTFDRLSALTIEINQILSGLMKYLGLKTLDFFSR